MSMPGTKMTKSDFVASLAEKSGLTKQQASSALAAINTIIVEQLGPSGPGEVLLPGMLKLSVAVKPATPERQGINPFTKQPTTFKARPARKVIKARPVKAFKEAL
jgi:nucleoid DNA-binding protein